MTCLQLTMSVMLNMLGSSLILMPTNLAEVGTMSLLAWGVTIIGASAISYVFAKCGRFNRRGGGLGAYSSYAFGKSGSFLANYTYGLSLVIANLTIAISIVGYLVVLFGLSLTPKELGFSSMAVIILCSLPLVFGARTIGHICNYANLGIVLPILFLSVVGWHWFSPELYIREWNPHSMSVFDGISASLSMTLWGFLGIEAAGANADQVENPERSVPRAMLFSTLGAGTVYILANNIAFGIIDNETLAHSTAPFGLVFAAMFGENVGKIVTGIMAVCCMGCLTSWQFTISEVFRVSSNEGYFPKIFGRVTSRNVPVIGIAIILAAQCLAAFLTIDPRLEHQFAVLKDIAVVTNLVPYLLVFASVLVLLQKEAQGSGSPKRVIPAASFASVYCLYALYACGESAMFWGALTTFAGYWLYGFAAKSLEKKGRLAEY